MDKDLAFLFEEEEEETQQQQPIDPDLSFLFEEENKEPVAPVATTSTSVDSDLSFLFEDETSTTEITDTDEPTFARKFDYGLEQEQTIFGNLWQSGVAGIRAAMSKDLNFEDALKQSEAERQKEIFEEYPEFKNSPEDAAIISGRIAQAFADPVTWLIPWTKIAKAGKIATTAAGAGVAAGDVALREKTLYGSVDPTSVILATVLGGGTAFGSDIIARKFRKKNLVDETDEATAATKIVDEPDVEITPTVAKVIKEEGESAYGDFTERLVSLDFDADLQTKVAAAIRVVDANRKLGIKTKAQRAKKLKLGPKKLKELGLPTTKKALEKFAIERAKETKEANKLFSSSAPNLVKLVTAKAESDIKAIAKVGKRIDWEDGVMRKLVYETTRPLFGAAGGAIAGTWFGDKDDDLMMYSLMGAGLAIGSYARAVDRARFMTKGEKEILTKELDNQARMTTRTAIKILSAGSHAARLSAFGGGSELFGKLMYKQQGGSLTSKATMGVESRARSVASELKVLVGTDVLRDIPEEMLEDIGKLRNGFISLDSLSTKYSPEDLINIQQASKNVEDFTTSFGNMVEGVGIDFKKLQNYGLTQLWDLEKIYSSKETQEQFRNLLYKAVSVQKFGTDATKIKEGIDALNKKYASVQTKNKRTTTYFQDVVDDIELGLMGKKAGSSRFDGGFMASKKNGEVVIPLLKNFEKDRVIESQDARLILQDFIINDPRKTLSALIDNTVPSVEFARTFGAKGELLKSIRPEIYKKYNPYRKGFAKTKDEQQELDQIYDSIDAFFGLYQADKKWGTTGTAFASVITALANSTMLTRVIIPSTGDLIQPFQNSGVRATLQGYAQMIKKGETFATKGVGIKYNNQMEADVKQLGFNPHPSERVASSASWFNDKFFRFVGLKKLTEFARERAYDSGVNRAYILATKAAKGGKVKTKELEQLGLDVDDLAKISKFKGVKEAYFDNPETKRILHKAGFMAMERDAIIPTVGNRHLFAQSHDPATRALGQFLSWAQAKTTQTNSLVSRIEDGDGKLAVRMLGGLVLYGGVREFQKSMSPSDYYDDPENQETPFGLRWLSEGAKLSGNFLPFYVDKLMGAMSGPGARDPITGGIPTLSLMTDIFKLGTTELPSNIAAGDWEGAGVDLLKVVPFGKDVNSWVLELEDKPNTKEGERRKYAEGHEVTDVPYVKENPEERINPRTGEPYTAIYKRRAGFGAGGIASILRGIWKAPTQDFTSAATSISQTPAGFKKIKALDGWQTGTKNLDIGGGSSFNGAHKHTDALKEEGVENVVFDPFNRAPEENALAVERLGFGQADTVTAHNVLNVIPDEGAQLQVLQQMENALKRGGKGYITVYKGAGTGKGKQSRSDSFQQNKKTDEYLPLVRKVFPNAERKGDVIFFKNTKELKQNERIIYTDDLTTPTIIKEIGTFKVIKDEGIDGNVNVGEILGIKVELFRDPGGLAGENYSMIITDARVKGDANIGLYANNLKEAQREAIGEIDTLIRKGELEKFTGLKFKTVYETDGRPYVFEDDKMLATLRSVINQRKS